MKVVPIILIETISGKLNGKAEYYLRRSKNGIIYSCKCPDRSKHVKTPVEAENQKRFADIYAGANKKSNL